MRAASGRLYAGCNVENASYPVTQCAEASAIGAMVTAGERGVDVGAIEFIHRRLVALRDAGQALLLVSVELDEILALADRILVMHDGRIVGNLPRAITTEQTIGQMMAGVLDS